MRKLLTAGEKKAHDDKSWVGPGLKPFVSTKSTCLLQNTASSRAECFSWRILTWIWFKISTRSIWTTVVARNSKRKFIEWMKSNRRYFGSSHIWPSGSALSLFINSVVSRWSFGLSTFNNSSTWSITPNRRAWTPFLSLFLNHNCW